MKENNYNSEADTLKHKSRVNELLLEACSILMERAKKHDDSKLENPEKIIFDEFTPKLKNSVYGSEEYNGFLHDMDVALKNHYRINSHHPEHFENGINDMTLFDLIEMFFDWKAASERHETGNIFKSVEINKDRFKMSEQLASIFTRTAESLYPRN